MRTTTTVTTTTEIELSEFERECFDRVESILATLQRYHEDRHNKTLVSLVTGEVIEIEEIARVRGILSGLVDSPVFEVK